MCLITTLLPVDRLVKDGLAEVDYEMLRNAWYFNEDGAGISFVDFNHTKETGGPVVRIYKSYYSFDKFLKVFKKLRELNPKSLFVVHFRNSSMGDAMNRSNCHPFWIYKNEMAMSHNGTIYKMNAKKNSGPSDSSLFADFLRKLPKNWIYNPVYFSLVKEYIGKSNKLAIITNKNEVFRFNHESWIHEGATWFSNDYYKKEKPKIVSLADNYKKEIGEGCAKCGAKWGNGVHPIMQDDKYYCLECFNLIRDEIKKQLSLIDMNTKVEHCEVCDLELNSEREKGDKICDFCKAKYFVSHDLNIYDEGV